MGSSEVFRVPSAACSARLPAAPDEHSSVRGWEMMLEKHSRAPRPALLAMSRSVAMADQHQQGQRCQGSCQHRTRGALSAAQGQAVAPIRCPRPPPAPVPCLGQGAGHAGDGSRSPAPSPRCRRGYTAARQPHSPEPQSHSGRCWWPGANSHPSPSKTTLARRQEMTQQGQLGGSRTRGCLSTCSSLEARC